VARKSTHVQISKNVGGWEFHGLQQIETMNEMNNDDRTANGTRIILPPKVNEWVMEKGNGSAWLVTAVTIGEFNTFKINAYSYSANKTKENWKSSKYWTQYQFGGVDKMKVAVDVELKAKTKLENEQQKLLEKQQRKNDRKRTTEVFFLLLK